MHFHATLVQSGKTATGIRVPPDLVERLGSGKRPAVRVTISGYTYRSTIAPLGDAFMLPVSAEIRGITGGAGDELDVEVDLDTEPREVRVPADFSEALDADPVAKRFFDTLSYTNKQRIVPAIEQAKTAETRQRRIFQSVDRLREKRTWVVGSPSEVQPSGEINKGGLTFCARGSP